jgi:hypothetical protein
MSSPTTPRSVLNRIANFTISAFRGALSFAVLFLPIARFFRLASRAASGPYRLAAAGVFAPTKPSTVAWTAHTARGARAESNYN